MNHEKEPLSKAKTWSGGGGDHSKLMLKQTKGQINGEFLYHDGLKGFTVSLLHFKMRIFFIIYTWFDSM